MYSLIRIWNVGKLTIKKIVPDGNAPISVVNTSNPAWGILDVKSEDLAWIGSVGTHNYNSNGLPGCIHQISFNGKQIGLWNFHSQSAKGSCKGCIEGCL